MRKQELIQRLNEEIITLKKEANLWKRKYFMIQQAYQQLLNGSVNNPNYFDNRKNQQEQITQLNYGLTSDKKNMQVTFDFDDIQQYTDEPKVQKKKSTNSTKIQHQQQNKVIRKLLRKATMAKTKIINPVRYLIEGCFILQKTDLQKSHNSVKFAYPEDIAIKCNEIFNIIYKYTFINDKIEQIHDDDFDSRKNQILFGTPYEDFEYIFDSSQGKQGLQNKFQKKTHLMKKRYIYGLVRPQIITRDSKSYQTQISIGFISSFPFPNFFKDINLIVQQQIKLELFNSEQQTANVQNIQRISLISKIIQNIVNKSQDISMVIQDYPILIELPTNVCTLKLAFKNQNQYIEHHLDYIEQLIQKFSLLKLIKIIHYMLTEKHLIIICHSRKRLNQLLKIIQILIHPLVWVFPIIYHYSSYFSPFLSSPLPLIVGYVQQQQMIEAEDDIEGYLDKISKQIPQNNFVTIYAEKQDQEDFNQIEIFNYRIQKCFKEIRKTIQQTKQQKQKKQQGIKNSRLTDIFCLMISKLTKFLENGQINQQLTPFHIQFMETQMASYYKENLNTIDLKLI